MNMRYLSFVCCLFLTLGFLSLGAIEAQAQELKIITLQHRFAQDLLPAIQPLVGPDGTASAVENHLMIRTSPERLQAIEQVIATLDTARRNVRITVSHEDVSQYHENRAGISGRARIDNVEIGTSHRARPGVNVDIGSTESTNIRSGSEFVTVLDGEQAFIRVGQSIPYTQQWRQLTGRYVISGQTTEFHEITTGFAVRPRHIGDYVELEITPRIAAIGNANTIDFKELSTVVRVSPGQWFDLGGNMLSRDEISAAILRQKGASGGREGSLSIRVD
jgi:type II secretory pathway component GspD/PulD (secretin)